MRAVHTLAVALALPALMPAQNLDPMTAWREFTARNGSGWNVEWNEATGTPAAIYGPGLKLDGRITNLEGARTAASNLLNRFAALLGKGQSNFVESIGVKANRTYVFVYDQKYRGLDVISGRADVRLNEAGVVAMFGSRAVQIPVGFNVRPGLSAAAAKAIAEGHVLGAASKAQGLPAPRLVIWGDSEAARGEKAQRTTATLAWEVQIDERPTVTVGKVYVDARGGRVLQFQNEVFECSCGKPHVVGVRNPHAARMANARRRREEVAAPAAASAASAVPLALTGKVMAWTNTGHLPTAALKNVPLANVLVTSSAGNAYTDATGSFSIPYTGTTPVVVTATLTGRHSRRVRVAQGSQLSGSASISPSSAGTIQIGTAAMGQFDRSQTTTYYFADDINVWIRKILPGAGSQINLMSNVNPRVNIASSCNAYYTNWTINFYAQSSSCANTAFETVIEHEWGHGIDHAFGGISQTDGLSEGWGDLLCTYRSGQAEVGPGFRNGSTTGIRTANNTRTYPAGGGVHQQGETWMGFGWDVRKNLIASLGSTTGIARAEKIVVASIVADATNQPNAVREVFILDDDDGNLNNGTPNYNDLEKAALKRRLPYPKKVNPNAGTYTTYGAGCSAGGGGNPACALNNPFGGTLTGATRTNEYAYTASSTVALSVTGFSIYSRSTSGGNVTVATAIYLPTAGGAPASTPIARGTMVIGSTAKMYRTNLSAQIPAGRFFVAVNHSANNTYISNLSAGARGGGYWRRGGGSWSGSGLVTRSSYVVHCGPPVPTLIASNVPELNTTFRLNLSSAKPNSVSLLLVGASDKAWNSLTLPFDLGTRAPGCKVLASGELQVGFTTSGAGTATQSFPVPNNSALFGVKFFNQYVVSDSTPVGFVLSNAGAGKIGKQ